MTRIKWGRIFAALLILLVFVYGGALLLGVARPEELPGVSAFPQLRDALRSGSPQAAPPGQPAQPTAAPQSPGQAAQPTAAPRPTTPPPTTAPQPTARPRQTAPDPSFRSEVRVPESSGTFPLGYVTVAFDKEFPPYAPVVLLYQEKLAEK